MGLFSRRSSRDSYNSGYDNGYDRGYSSGYDNGYIRGRNDGLGRGALKPDGPFGVRNITELTERVLSGDNDIAFLTSEGYVLPINDAFMLGLKTGIQLLKGREWGYRPV